MTLARSFACIANQEWEAREDPKRPKGVWNVDAIYRACAFCQKAIEHGLTPRLAPCIGHMVEKTGLRRWEDMRLPIPGVSTHGVSPDKFQELKRFWEVTDKLNETWKKDKAKVEEKKGRTPNAYICAAEGCGIETTSKKSLMRCSGPCTGADKPSYCSKDCQRQVSAVNAELLRHNSERFWLCAGLATA